MLSLQLFPLEIGPREVLAHNHFLTLETEKETAFTMNKHRSAPSSPRWLCPQPGTPLPLLLLLLQVSKS